MILGFGGKDLEGVGCYGKLPHYGDYVSHLSDGKEARRLTQWLDEGYRITGGKDDREAAETRFVFPGRKRNSLVGMLWPSGDASGTRRFPFAVFAEIPTRTLGPMEALLTLGLAPTWGLMADAHAEIAAAESQDRISTRLAEIRVPPLAHRDNVRRSFGEIAGGILATPAARDTLFEVWRFANAIGGGKQGTAPAFSVRIPLVTNADPEIEAALWITRLSLRLGTPHLANECTILLRAGKDGAPGHCFLIHRELRAEDLGFVLQPTDEYPYGNLLQVGEASEALDAFRADLAEKLDKNATLADLARVKLS